MNPFPGLSGWQLIEFKSFTYLVGKMFVTGKRQLKRISVSREISFHFNLSGNLAAEVLPISFRQLFGFEERSSTEMMNIIYPHSDSYGH